MTSTNQIMLTSNRTITNLTISHWNQQQLANHRHLTLYSDCQWLQWKLTNQNCNNILLTLFKDWLCASQELEKRQKKAPNNDQQQNTFYCYYGNDWLPQQNGHFGSSKHTYKNLTWHLYFKINLTTSHNKKIATDMQLYYEDNRFHNSQNIVHYQFCTNHIPMQPTTSLN